MTYISVCNEDSCFFWRPMPSFQEVIAFLLWAFDLNGVYGVKLHLEELGSTWKGLTQDDFDFSVLRDEEACRMWADSGLGFK